MVVEYMQNSVGQQLPALLPALFPGVPRATSCAANILSPSYRAQGKCPKPSDTMVVGYMRNSVGQQFPALMPTLVPGGLMTAAESYSASRYAELQ